MRKLLQDVDGLAFPERQRRLAATARTATSSELDALLDELFAAGAFERRLALHMATVAGRHGFVVRCLDAPDDDVVVRAAVAAVRSGAGLDVLSARFASLPTAHRRVVYRAVRRNHATSVAETLLPIVRDRFGDVEAASLLVACTSDSVAALLPELGYALSGWTGIAHRHPRVFLDRVDTELATTPRSEWTALLQRMGSDLAVVAADEPSRVLDVLDRTASDAAIPPALGPRLGVVARSDPARLMTVLLHPGRPGAVPAGRTVWRSLLSVDDGRLVRLARALGPGNLTRFLHVLPPSRRAAVFDGLVGTGDLLRSGVPVAALDELPVVARAEFARRQFAFRSVVDDPAARLALTARLPWPEAEPVLRAATRRATADERAEAYPLYIGAAAGTRDPAVVERMITSLTRLANEQEPVRVTAVQAIARIPAWLFTAPAVSAVSTVMRDAAQARDSSWLSQRAIRAVADRLVREGAIAGRPELLEAGIGVIEMMSQAAQTLQLSSLERDLPRGAEHLVFDVLRPRIESEVRRGEYSVALALADGLGRRAWDMPALQAFVDQARDAKNDSVVRRAIQLWLRPRATRDDRVAAVLRKDRSTIVFDAVRSAVGWRRTDLLDLVLDKPIHGRFLKRGVRYIPVFFGCFDRWLPRQRARYVQLLLELARARDVRVWEQANAVHCLGFIPADASILRPFLTHQQAQVRDAALTALGRSSPPALALPELLAFADGDRAHIAVAAAARCARFVAPARLADAISPALQGRKVTARKEAVRILAEHHSPSAMSLLVQVWAVPDQHRDVRRAIVSAGRWLLDDERMWPLLAQAAADEDLVTAVLAIGPDVIAVRHRPRFAELVRQAALLSSPDIARRGLAVLPAWVRWDTGASVDGLVGLVGDLDRTATWRPALTALVAAVVITGADAPLLSVAESLVARRAAVDPDPAFDAAADRDQPVRQRLGALSEAVISGAERTTSLRATALPLADVLAADAVCREFAVALAVAGTDWSAPDIDVSPLRTAVAFADSPALARVAAEQAADCLRSVLHVVDVAALFRIVTALVEDGGVAAGAVALAITDVVGPQTGWAEDWRSIVRHYRAHPDPDTRLAAHRIVTAHE